MVSKCFGTAVANSSSVQDTAWEKDYRRISMANNVSKMLVSDGTSELKNASHSRELSTLHGKLRYLSFRIFTPCATSGLNTASRKGYHCISMESTFLGAFIATGTSVLNNDFGTALSSILNGNLRSFDTHA
jgi:hypothetical protein